MHYLATNYNNQDKVCFLFNNTDSHNQQANCLFRFSSIRKAKEHHNN